MNMYKYGYLHERGYGLGCQPRGFSKVSEGDDKYHAYVWYENALDEKQLKTYELVLVKEKEND